LCRSGSSRRAARNLTGSEQTFQPICERLIGGDHLPVGAAVRTRSNKSIGNLREALRPRDRAAVAVNRLQRLLLKRLSQGIGSLGPQLLDLIIWRSER
jgi:hypothetical protein